MFELWNKIFLCLFLIFTLDCRKVLIYFYLIMSCVVFTTYTCLHWRDVLNFWQLDRCLKVSTSIFFPEHVCLSFGLQMPQLFIWRLILYRLTWEKLLTYSVSPMPIPSPLICFRGSGWWVSSLSFLFFFISLSFAYSHTFSRTLSFVSLSFSPFITLYLSLSSVLCL